MRVVLLYFRVIGRDMPFGRTRRCDHSGDHGYYFVYLQFDEEKRADRWFTEYEPGDQVFGENGTLTGNVHGFQTFEEAQAYCEKDAEVVGRHLGL